MTNRCPTCNQPITVKQVRVAARTCFDCKVPMKVDHKWTYQQRNGVMTPVHQHCDNPVSYLPK